MSADASVTQPRSYQIGSMEEIRSILMPRPVEMMRRLERYITDPAERLILFPPFLRHAGNYVSPDGLLEATNEAIRALWSTEIPDPEDVHAYIRLLLDAVIYDKRHFNVIAPRIGVRIEGNA